MDAELPEEGTRARLMALAFAPGHPAVGEGFPGASLAGIELPGATLRRADLSGADLTRADFTDASCGGIRLAGASLEQATLARADLTAADLTGVRGGQAGFSGALLEDAVLDGGMFRFSHFDDAVLDGASLVGVDLWGAVLTGVSAERACLRDAHLDEANAVGGHFRGADLSGASLRGADLTHAVLPFVDVTSCDLTHVRLAGAWLERTRMTVAQLGGAVGEEVAREYAAAYDAYTALELNFRSLGRGDDESWAYRRRRRMGKLAHRASVQAAFARRLTPSSLLAACRHGWSWFVDGFVEWLSDYGESLPRVFRAIIVVLLVFAAAYWVTGGLAPREDIPESLHRGLAVLVLDHLLFSLNSMTTVGPGQVELKPVSELAVLLSSLETVFGTVLIGLFGFVLGARMRR